MNLSLAKYNNNPCLLCFQFLGNGITRCGKSFTQIVKRYILKFFLKLK